MGTLSGPDALEGEVVNSEGAMVDKTGGDTGAVGATGVEATGAAVGATGAAVGATGTGFTAGGVDTCGRRSDGEAVGVVGTLWGVTVGGPVVGAGATGVGAMGTLPCLVGASEGEKVGLNVGTPAAVTLTAAATRIMADRSVMMGSADCEGSKMRV